MSSYKVHFIFSNQYTSAANHKWISLSKRSSQITYSISSRRSLLKYQPRFRSLSVRPTLTEGGLVHIELKWTISFYVIYFIASMKCKTADNVAEYSSASVIVTTECNTTLKIRCSVARYHECRSSCSKLRNVLLKAHGGERVAISLASHDMSRLFVTGILDFQHRQYTIMAYF